MLVRLQKFIADCQIASRRKAEEFIKAGLVRVNGEVVRELGTKVDTDKDVVLYDGKTLRAPKDKVYIMLHKPDGYVTTVKDQFGRKAVTELVADIPARLYPVGRLDYDTSGLLIMTNDGDMAYKLTHPKFMIKKVYVVRVKGKPDEETLQRLRTGIEIDGQMTAPADVAVVKEYEDASSLRITIHEGRNRQVRKMLDAVGYRVMSLKRVATGKLFLGELPKGKYRRLTDAEVGYLKSMGKDKKFDK